MGMRVRELMPAILAFGVPATINLASIMVFTRLLSLYAYGELSLAWVTIEFTCGIFYRWSKMGMIRFFDRSQRSIIVGIQFTFGVSCLMLLVLLLLFLFGERSGWVSRHTFIFPVMLGIIARGVATFIQDVQRIYHEKLARYTFVSFLCNAAYYLPVIGLAIWTRGNIRVDAILYIQAFALLLLCLGISARPLWLLRKKLFRKQQPGMYRGIMHYGIPIAIASVAIGMFARIDRYVIEYVLGFRELGIYSAAFSLSNLVVSSIFTVLTISSYPEIIRRLNSGRQAEAKVLFRQNGQLILTAVPVFVCCACLLNTFLCQVLFGGKAPEISGVFPYVLLATYLFNLRIHYFDQVFQFSHTTRVSMYLAIVLGAGHLALSFLLTRTAGIHGIALSNALMSLAGIVFTWVFVRRIFRIELSKPVVALNIAGLIAITIYLMLI
ncbi:hypothetical protein CCY01nite_37080 [Chitinophaga cymbidii]|uniref:Polysaccharide biosynthesis protein C-terminal domain-containing protein n=2 Tax=Chitinophaga cymbidii TaxID=1096750 RepID=A0A512RP23_9BACT|nr:hypothetical protein CCY01nite_37080 [Chitinophaga cymbidii]